MVDNGKYSPLTSAPGNGDGGGHLDLDGPISVHEYHYLKGDEVYWPAWGAALGVCAEWCRRHGYGDFGKPTDRGKQAMKAYEHEHRL